MFKRYPSEMRKKARKLVKMGVPKTEISRMMGVGYMTLYLWTRDMRRCRGNIGIMGRTLELLRLLVERGYILSSEVKQMTSCPRMLGRYFPIRRVKFSNIAIWYLVGKERDAMEGLLKSLKKRSIGYHELGYLRRAFGIKNMKGNNKLARDTNPRKEVERI